MLSKIKRNIDFSGIVSKFASSWQRIFKDCYAALLHVPYQFVTKEKNNLLCHEVRSVM
jgi:hypothetical protein